MAAIAAAERDMSYIIVIHRADGLRGSHGVMFEGSPDPFVQVTCKSANMDFQTIVAPGTKNPVWDHGAMLSIRTSEGAAHGALITCKVMDHAHKKGNFLGTCDFDIMDILSKGTANTWVDAQATLGGHDIDCDKDATGILFISVRSFTKFNIKIDSAANLRNADGYIPGIGSDLSDPYARVTGLSSKTQSWGVTKTIMDSLSPKFNDITGFNVDVRDHLKKSGEMSRFQIEFFDEDNKKRCPNDQKLGLATIPWKSVFPDAAEGDGMKKTFPLTGSGAGMAGNSQVDVIITTIHTD